MFYRFTNHWWADMNTKQLNKRECSRMHVYVYTYLYMYIYIICTYIIVYAYIYVCIHTGTRTCAYTFYVCILYIHV